MFGEEEYECGCKPDRAFVKLVMERLELSGDYWKQTLGAAMTGDPACAADVLAHCEKQQPKETNHEDH